MLIHLRHIFVEGMPSLRKVLGVEWYLFNFCFVDDGFEDADLDGWMKVKEGILKRFSYSVIQGSENDG